MNVCVVRFKDQKRGEGDFAGFATTNMELPAAQIIRTYQARPEVEEDYPQLKSARWQIDPFCATRLVQIICHLILTLRAYDLFQVYHNTQAGRAFAGKTKQKMAGKTKQKIEREHARNHTTYLLVCTRDAFAIFETKALLALLLRLPDDIQLKICDLLPQKLE